MPQSPVPASALSSHRFLMRSALAAGSAFAWVFVLQYFYGLTGDLARACTQVILLYALAQVVTALLTPYTAQMLGRGVRRSMFWGVLVCALGFSLWGGALSGFFAETRIAGIVGFTLFLGAYRALYWIPYALEHAEVGRDTPVSQEFFIALMPAITGYALTEGALSAALLLFACIIIALVSLVPLVRVPESYERFSWGYREAFGELFESKFKPIVESSFLEGVHGAALLIIWPLTIFLIVGASYRLLGLVLTVTLLLALPLRRLGRNITRGRHVLHIALAASAWALRLIVATPVGVIFADVYASVGRPLSAIDLYALEHSADNGTFVDELTALKEIAMCIGRITMCVITAFCISAFSLPVGLAVAFIVAALSAALSILQTRREEQAAF